MFIRLPDWQWRHTCFCWLHLRLVLLSSNVPHLHLLLEAFRSCKITWENVERTSQANERPIAFQQQRHFLAISWNQNCQSCIHHFLYVCLRLDTLRDCCAYRSFRKSKAFDSTGNDDSSCLCQDCLMPRSMDLRHLPSTLPPGAWKESAMARY